MYKKREEMDEEEGLVIEDPGLGSKQCTYTWVCVLCVCALCVGFCVYICMWICFVCACFACVLWLVCVYTNV